MTSVVPLGIRSGRRRRKEDEMAVEGIVALVVALEFAAFGWRITREIAVGDEGRKTWLPVADLANLLMLMATVAGCVVYPLAVGGFGATSKAILAIAAVLVAFHPLTTAGHYGLILARSGERYTKADGDFTYCTSEEALFFVLSLAGSAVAAWLVVVA